MLLPYIVINYIDKNNYMTAYLTFLPNFFEKLFCPTFLKSCLAPPFERWNLTQFTYSHSQIT